MWQDLPASMYLFNVLNPAEVSAGAKSEVEEVGPYVITEQHHKFVGSLNDTFTIVN
jgi:hypothetical protein